MSGIKLMENHTSNSCSCNGKIESQWQNEAQMQNHLSIYAVYFITLNERKNDKRKWQKKNYGCAMHIIITYSMYIFVGTFFPFRFY